MFVSTRIEFDIHTGLVLRRTGFRYEGPVCLLKGASSAETNLQQQQADFYSTLQKSYASQFAGQGAILSSLSKSFQPILDAGINQFGFNPAETAALRTQASEGTAGIYGQASRALGTSIAANSGTVSRAAPVAAGGETYIPSGQVGAAQEELAASAANAEAKAQLGITEAGFAQGRQNYLTAASGLGGVAGQMSPTAYISGANTAGSDAFGSAKTIEEQNAAASPWGAIGGLVGGVAGSFLGPIGGAIGSKLGGMIGGAASGSGGGDGSGAYAAEGVS